MEQVLWGSTHVPMNQSVEYHNPIMTSSAEHIKHLPKLGSPCVEPMFTRSITSTRKDHRQS